MNTIKNIKVTAEYEVDTKPSKFDALLAQYEIAKTIADEIEDSKQPLINAMGQKKLELIYEQLDTIVQRVNIISKYKDEVVAVKAWDWSKTADRKDIMIKSHWNWEKPEIYLCGYTTPKDSWFKVEGIVTLWNDLGLYRKLEEECEKMLEKMIQNQNNKTNRINTNYDNMMNK